MPSNTATPNNSSATNPYHSPKGTKPKRLFTKDDFELIGSSSRDDDTPLLINTFVSGTDERMDPADSRPLQFTMRWEGGKVEGSARADAGAALSCVITAVKAHVKSADNTNSPPQPINGSDVVVLDCIDWSSNASLPAYTFDSDASTSVRQRGFAIRHSSADHESDSDIEGDLHDSYSGGETKNESNVKQSSPYGAFTNYEGKVANFIIDGHAAPTFVTSPAEDNKRGSARKNKRSSLPNPHPHHERLVISSLSDLTAAVEGIRRGWNPKAFMAAVQQVKGDDGDVDEEADAKTDDDVSDAEDEFIDTTEATPSLVLALGKDDVIAAMKAERRWWPQALAFLADATIVVSVIATADTVEGTNPAKSAECLSVAAEYVGYPAEGRHIVRTKEVTDLVAPVSFPSSVAHGSVLMFALINAPSAANVKKDSTYPTCEWILKPLCIPLSTESRHAEKASPTESNNGTQQSWDSLLAAKSTRSYFSRMLIGGGNAEEAIMSASAITAADEETFLLAMNLSPNVLDELQLSLVWRNTTALVELHAQDAKEGAKGTSISVAPRRGAYIKRRGVSEIIFDKTINRRPPFDAEAAEARRRDAKYIVAKAEERRTILEWSLMVLAPLLASFILYQLAH